MTIRLLCAYDKYPANAIVSLDAGTEAGLIAAKTASASLTGGVTYYPPPTSKPLTAASGRFLNNVARQRTVGIAANAPIAGTFTLGRRAPGPFDAVRAVLTGAASSAVNTFKLSIATSAKYNNGYMPVSAAGAALPFTLFTFGTTDVENPRNPGGGAANTLIENASGSGVTLVEGSVSSDILQHVSQDRTDIAGADPFYILRLQGTNPPAKDILECSSASPNPFSSVIPEFYSGYWAGADYTTADPPGAPTQGWLPCVDLIFYLRGKVVYSIANAADSLGQGWVPTSVVPQFGGNINGWCRQMVAMLNDAGITASYTALNNTGNYSEIFHNRAINALYSGGLTHLFLAPWSVNETANGVAGVVAALKRVSLIIGLAAQRRVKLILVRPWAGQGLDMTLFNMVQAYCDQYAASGGTAADAREVVSADPASNNIRPEFAVRDASGAIFDTIHLNNAGHEAVGRHFFNTRAAFALS
ncbi:hypothetical protein HSX11_01690 [Oxalobacteraceae bacterium]|nr:hypothetical protein [Oxalobacteraceae bacterium]